MSKFFKGVATVAGIVAGGLAILGTAGLAAPVVAGITLSSGLFSGIAAAATTLSQITAKAPLSVPALDDYTVGPSSPYPYVMGRARVFGNMIHREAHGREQNDVPNPYLTMSFIYSGGGPVEDIDQILVNNDPVTFGSGYYSAGVANGYYGSFLRFDGSRGALTEFAAIDTNSDGKQYWGPASKLSGYSAGQVSLFLNKENKRYKGGTPKFSAVLRGVKAYDPRLDSTYPGGLGSHRSNNEFSWSYTQNAPLHGLTYALGRRQGPGRDKLVCGAGVPITDINVASFVAAANINDANGWTIGGVVYENGEKGELWNNLKLILAAGGCRPTNDGGVLTCISTGPQVAIDTITAEDIKGSFTVPGMTKFKNGFNTVIPKYRSEANDWAYVPSDAVTVQTLKDAQGEERTKERQFDLVTDRDQAVELGIYAVYDSVEISQISLVVGRRFINYRVGDAMRLLIPALNLDHIAVIQQHTINAATGEVALILRTDTQEKHGFALGQTGTAPPHPQLLDVEEYDTAAEGFSSEADTRSAAILNSSILEDISISAVDAGSSATITVPSHTRTYGDPQKFSNVVLSETIMTGFAYDQVLYLYYDDDSLTGLLPDPDPDDSVPPQQVPFAATTARSNAYATEAYPFRHYVGRVTTPSSGATEPNTGQPSNPPGVPPYEEETPPGGQPP